ncbi:putative nuclease S1 precursor [Metarhizium anisopliae]|uniref:Nuclease S1 n=2 Tax=Metarhizium TaxID=5529 RepID=A0A0D9NPN8_METAN
MKLSVAALALGLASVPGTVGWGSLGHITTAYLAGHFVANTTEAFFKDLLRSQDDDYMAKVASWADSIRYTKWGRFTKNFHFIDAHDDPPRSCNVDFDRDCKEDGCVISALANYTKQSLDSSLPAWRRAQAAKFVIHFVGDLHQPLHNEDVALGGNRIHVLWDGKSFNLHHVWDTSIAEKWIGGMRGKPYPLAEKWANQLAGEINDGKFATEKGAWLKGLNFTDAIETAMAWSREANAFVCTHVLPEGPHAIVGQELGGDYFKKAGPVIERQVARAGFRMAAWLDKIADGFDDGTKDEPVSLEL